MANETTYALINSESLVNTVLDAALMHLRADNVMAASVTTFNDQQGLAPRKGSKYGGGTFSVVTEATDMSATAWTRTALATLTPAIYGKQYFVTDARIKSDPVNVMADAAEELGAEAAKIIEEGLLDAMASFTGGTIGSAGSTITWGHVFATRTKLQAAAVRPPYYCVLHPYQWHILAKASPTSGVMVTQPAIPQASLNTAFSVKQVDDIFFMITPDLDIDGSGDAKGGMYGRAALALDVRQPFRIEAQRDASRGGGGTELNATLVVGLGVWDASQGVIMLFDAPAPTS